MGRTLKMHAGQEGLGKGWPRLEIPLTTASQWLWISANRRHRTCGSSGGFI